MFHFADAAEYLGLVGWDELAAAPGAVDSLLVDGWREDDLRYLRADGDHTGYLFRCRHCGAAMAYMDSS